MSLISEAVKESFKEEAEQLPSTLTHKDIMRDLQLGKDKVYELLRSDNGIPCRRLGWQFRVNKFDYLEWKYKNATIR